MNSELIVQPEDTRVRCVELFISNLLRGGVFASLLFIIGGTLLTFAQHPGLPTSAVMFTHLTQPGAVFPHTWSAVVAGARRFDGQALVIVGLFILIATPIMRVAVSILAFIYQEDRVFVFITSVVFCLLLLSFVLGKGE
jgi:uncharacterized membrane protein